LALLILTFLLITVGSGLGFAMQGDWRQALMFGGVGGGICLFALAMSAERSQLWLDARSGAATHRRRTVRGNTQTTWALDQVDKATCQITRGSKGAVLRRPAILLRSGQEVPLLASYTSGGGPERAIAAINAWLARHRA